MPNPAITESPEYKDQFQAEQPINPISKTQELVSKYFGTKEEAPVLNQAKIDRLQRMGRINTLGRGLNVLGDGLSLALGANVKRKAPDTTAPALYQSYENTLDKHEQEVKGYKHRDFQKKLSDIQFGISRLDKENDQDYRERVQKANDEFRKVKNGQDLAKWQLEFKLKEEKNESDIERNKLTGKAAIIRATNKSGSKTKPEKPFMVIGQNGQERPIAQGEFRALLEEAQNTKGWSKEDFKTMMAPFENTPLEGQKNIVQRYSTWKAKQQALKEINDPEFKAGEKAALDRIRKERGLSTDPVNTTAQPKAKAVPSFFQ